MRLWHQYLITLLPRNQLLGQHRECCALRGRGWGRKHSTVDYVFNYPPSHLIAYHYLVMDEMMNRHYKINDIWLVSNYRGKQLEFDKSCWGRGFGEIIVNAKEEKVIIYPEHNHGYMAECLANLRNKGIIITSDKLRNL